MRPSQRVVQGGVVVLVKGVLQDVWDEEEVGDLDMKAMHTCNLKAMTGDVEQAMLDRHLNIINPYMR